MSKDFQAGRVIKTSIITGFTLAAALIWRDFIVEAAQIIYPGTELWYKFVVAVIVTILVIIAIVIVLKTEHEVEEVVEGLTKNNKKGRKKISF